MFELTVRQRSVLRSLGQNLATSSLWHSENTGSGVQTLHKTEGRLSRSSYARRGSATLSSSAPPICYSRFSVPIGGLKISKSLVRRRSASTHFKSSPIGSPSEI